MEYTEQSLSFPEEDAEKLILWFSENRRDLPFRRERNSYSIYVSEIMLQQTRISAVIPYYLRFVERFPDMKSLAGADDDELLKLWEGLGYYSRVRNMKKAALLSVERYGGELPDTEEGMLSLPGVGSYTAGAVLSLAFDRKVPVVDGNVQRVLLRLTGDRSDALEPRTRKRQERLLRDFLERTGVSPSAFNEALMELGERLCIPNGQPLCVSCPLSESCTAFRDGLTAELPVRASKKKKAVRELTVFLLYCGGRLCLVKRTESGVLKGMFGLPVHDGFLNTGEAEGLLRGEKLSFSGLTELTPASHAFTHLEWRMRAYRAVLSELPAALFGSGVTAVTAQMLSEHIALPGAFRKWELFSLPEET